MDDLLKEAIADAKAVRETALANAKMALEEAFTPKLKSMLAQKIQSEIEDEDEISHADEVEDEEEGYANSEEGEEEDAEEISHADEIEDEDEMAHEGEEEDSEEGEDAEEGSYKEEEDKEEGEDEDHDEMAHEVEDKEEEEDDDDALDLESILKELEADLTEEEDEDKEEVEEVEDKDEEEKVDENDVSSDIGKADNKVNPEANDSSKTGAQGPEGEGKDEPAGNELDDHEVVKEGEDKEEEMDEDIDLEEVLKALSEEEDEEDKKDEIAKLQGEVKEHREVVKFLRDKLNEVNLLNAKLLFSNKLFRAFGLSNEQKLKVVETFDRTSNLREIKLVYSTLAESFKGTSVKPVNESKGSSSKPVASTKPQNEEVISEGAELKNRFKKLANIL